MNNGEIILESLLSSNIDCISYLNLNGNNSWFFHDATKKEISSNISLLAELISKQAGIENLHLSANGFTSNAT